MRCVRLAVVPLLAIAFPSSAQQQAPVGGVGADLGPESATQVGEATFKPDLVDKGNSTAKAVAESFGITVGEATRRLVQQQRSVLLVERLRTQYPDTFTGLAFQQKAGSGSGPSFRKLSRHRQLWTAPCARQG